MAVAIFPLSFAAPAVAEQSGVSTQAFTPIEERYWNESDLREVLGDPVDTEYDEGDISYREYQRGWLYYSEDTGVHELHGDIADRFVALGAHDVLGVPTTDEIVTPDGVGRFNHFTGSEIAMGEASVYWTPDTGAHGVAGPVRDFWESKGWETGYLSYPTSSTTGTADGGRFNHFDGGDGAGASVYWSDETGAHSVQGKIRHLWASQGWENGLGYPTTDELPTASGHGRYNEFTGNDNPPAAAYWSPYTGAHYVDGALLEHWDELGRESSYLGFPTSDPYQTTGGTVVEFQNGFISQDRNTGEVTDEPYRQ
ncbi:hypothetical protein GCM10027563_19530 [Parasphingorhabdus pacifica]